MEKTGIFYGSTNGTTADIAELIKGALGEGDIHEVGNSLATQIAEYDLVLLGTSTWGDGDLQDDWDDVVDLLDNADFTDKKVALFGLGDQESYPDTFVNGMGTLYERVAAKGAAVIGAWPTEGYSFDESTAVKDGKFVGLVIDEDNQSDQTGDRVSSWVNQLRREF